MKREVQNLEFEQEPFSHLSLSPFLKEEDAQRLYESLLDEDFYEEDHDLYQFYRTIDLKDSETREIQELREVLLSEDFMKELESLTQIKLLREKLDLHALLLMDTHYLLCHDDQVQGRKVAFILNLSKDWVEHYGGALELFESEEGKALEVKKRIYPSFNQFNLFLVSEKSFHQIQEVEDEGVRISLSGWYYEAE
jgi:Rps23 Pro-64 3,4-dihydroxylase Tpa1-like proline 4-hydroxylase